MTSNPPTIHDKMIVMAASKSYGPSLLALLGSLTLNWPQHPPVRVYDIGLDEVTLSALHENSIEVVSVPPFCPHWRLHFTWKLWCLNDAPTRDMLWMDAGVAVLKPLDEIFDALDRIGYFLVPNYQLLDWEASEAACRGCGVPFDFRLGKPTLAGTLMGFRKEGPIMSILREALEVALTEENIMATDRSHRHDQAIISLLMYKHLGYVVKNDKTVYLSPLLSSEVPIRRVWVHRRKMAPEDMAHFAAHIATPGKPYWPHPLPPSKGWRGVTWRLQHFVRRVVTSDPRTLPQRLYRFFYYRLRPPRERHIYHGVRD